jgi:hypothetical protein
MPGLSLAARTKPGNAAGDLANPRIAFNAFTAGLACFEADMPLPRRLHPQKTTCARLAWFDVTSQEEYGRAIYFFCGPLLCPIG